MSNLKVGDIVRVSDGRPTAVVGPENGSRLVALDPSDVAVVVKIHPNDDIDVMFFRLGLARKWPARALEKVDV